MNVIVFGNGRSGQAAATLLRDEGHTVTILDGTDPFPAPSTSSPAPSTKHQAPSTITPAPSTKHQAPGTICITSPGIALDHPWQQAARAAGIPVVSELQLGVERWRAMGGRLLAITGSKGKSSVVKLVAQALDGVPCGNYGTPVCEIVNTWRRATGSDVAPSTSSPAPSTSSPAPRTKHQAPSTTLPLPWAVVEVSSFQMETTTLPADAFVAATILNLQEDHLDRHGSVEVYHGLKRKLLTMAETRVDGDDFALDADLLAGSYFDNPVLRSNGCCAIGLLRTAGLADAAIRQAFASFEPLPHRMQTVCEKDGVIWIDDSKATSLAALAAGVEMAVARLDQADAGTVPSGLARPGLTGAGTVPDGLARPGRAERGTVPRVLLIAGGLEKGDNPFSFIQYLRSGVKKVYLIGHCADQFFSAWHSAIPCEICGTLDRAVEAARRDACAGEAVLLSPGTASFDQFKNYGARGDAFAAFVRAEA